MKLGIAYNVFDGEELLEKSILSMKSNVSFVCVVYQQVSNFGDQAAPSLERVLARLVERGLVDELILYEPKPISDAVKDTLVSPLAMPQEIGGPASGVSNQFFHELQKRELGRKACLKRGCSHFMTMDTDEFYIAEQVRAAMQIIETDGVEGSACKMRMYFKNGNYELLPYDELNWVPFIYVCRENAPLLLACPYPITVDPTRRMSNITRFKMFDRPELEMHHLTLVRMNIASKFLSSYCDLLALNEWMDRCGTCRIETITTRQRSSSRILSAGHQRWALSIHIPTAGARLVLSALCPTYLMWTFRQCVDTVFSLQVANDAASVAPSHIVHNNVKRPTGVHISRIASPELEHAIDEAIMSNTCLSLM